MWNPWHPETIWASVACYKYSFTVLHFNGRNINCLIVTFNDPAMEIWKAQTTICSQNCQYFYYHLPDSFLFSLVRASFCSRVLSNSCVMRWSSVIFVRKSRWDVSYRTTVSSSLVLMSMLTFSRCSTRFCSSRAVLLACAVWAFVSSSIQLFPSFGFFFC